MAIALASPASLATIDIFEDTFAPSCSVDADADRLADCIEVAGSIYGGSTNPGTNPNDQDTDDDGLLDGDEVLGTTAGLALPSMGVSPLHKDILIEYDWTEDTSECPPPAHSHKPLTSAFAEIDAIFDAMPIANPDGVTGISIVQDYGQGAPFTGGNFISIPGGVITSDTFGTDFQNYKAANFSANRQDLFHYVVLAHAYYNLANLSSGYGDILGDDIIISLHCYNGPEALDILARYTRSTLVHELGHNLGLQHGGYSGATPSCNGKPNYNSVMNYLFQFKGVDVDCNHLNIGTNEGSTNAATATYSSGIRWALNENNLDERDGICRHLGAGLYPIDWNGVGGIQVSVSANINPLYDGSCGGAFTTLTDDNDFANLHLYSRYKASQRLSTPCPPPPDSRQLQRALSVTGHGASSPPSMPKQEGATR